MGWIALAAAVGCVAGCQSHQVRDDTTAGDTVQERRMTASFSSDSAGIQDQDALPPMEAGMPIQLTLDQLPPAAQATVRREAGAKRVVKIKRETRDGEAVYRVELTRDGDLFHGLLLVTADGELLREAHLTEPRSSVTPTNR